ncbi:hypothetical protein YB2330_004822 [Saitoella coloradoensis]
MPSAPKPRQEMSDYEFLKPWGGMKGFMESYALKLYNPKDVEEAKAMIRQMKEGAVQDRGF